ncbi:HAD-IA family hydrolase [Sphingomonas montana]|uniref:HAD-IA family hydrolase n=1 Tax=Sphingomonas montana TaxID=1843236 RepID=UPI00096F5673|nr:HAD-IA family hydrolase [Sphingomonas montana]
MTRLAVFDCDGTLVDSQSNIVNAMTAALETEGLPPLPRATVLGIVGLSIFEAVAALLPRHDAAAHHRIAQAYKAAFHAQRARGEIHEPLYDGIRATLDTLAADGWQLGVATGKSDRGLALCLAHHGLTDHFVTLQTADRHPSKPHPSMLDRAMADAGASPADTVMIGDTGYDIAMGRAAGVATIGVSWGYHHTDLLIAAGATHIATHARDLPALLAALTPETA